jgi:hypothetical protein
MGLWPGRCSGTRCRGALIRRLYETRQESGAFTAFLVQLKLPSAGEYSEAFRCVYEITRECGSSPQLVDRERASEDQETFRGPSRRQLGQTMRSVAQ